MKNNQVLILMLCLLPMAFTMSAQTEKITGKVCNGKHEPIADVTVVLQRPDSSFVAVVITGEDGCFQLEGISAPFRLIFQHLAYETKQMEANICLIGEVPLEETAESLNALVVSADRPFVKVEDGKLGYDLSALAGNQSVSNAYDAIKKLPGVREQNGALSLAGATGVTVILNGKPTTMNASQLETLLKNMPVDRVQKAEVMYSAPPQYHVRGAAINIVTKRTSDYSFQGEVKAEYRNSYYNSGTAGANLRMSSPKSAFDLMYNLDKTNEMFAINMESNHTLAGKLYPIIQNQRIEDEGYTHNIRGAYEYTISDKSRFELAYTGILTPNEDKHSFTTGNYQNSTVLKAEKRQMHNVSGQYQTGIGLKVGMDYTHYTADHTQQLNSTLDQSAVSYDLYGGQQIGKYSVFADQQHALAKDWTLGYGISYAYASDKDFQIYTSASGGIQPENTDSRLNEHTGNFYLSAGKTFKSGTSFSISATGEYYAIGNYRKWSVYPQATFMYMKSPKHVFQLALASDKTYPGYWDMQTSVSYLDAYSEVHGTPDLRPMASYSLTGSYILNQKFIFTLYYSYIKDYFTQSPYQSTQKLALIYKTQNWNYQQNFGVNVILPFKAGNWLDSRLTLTGFNMRERCDDFFDIPFDRNKWAASVSLDNTFRVTKSLSFDLNAMYLSPVIQGTYTTTKHIVDLSVGGKWNFAKEKAAFILRCTDLLERSQPPAAVLFNGQNLIVGNQLYTRGVSLSFTYKFGGYTKRERKAVDVSRFGH